MAETNNEASKVEEVKKTRPVVGLLGKEGLEDEVAREIIRIMSGGYDVLLLPYSGLDNQITQAAEQIGCYVINPQGNHADMNVFRDLLCTWAKARSYPGLIVHTDPKVKGDYKRSERRLKRKDQYTIESVMESQARDNQSRLTMMVAIPAYNEASTIGDVVRQSVEYTDHVYVIDDGSTDETGEAASQEGASVIKHDSNKGYGAALKSAFSLADEYDMDHLIVLDGDGQHDPADIPEMIQVLKEAENDIVIGSRRLKSRDSRVPFYRRVGLGIVNLLTNTSLGRIRPSTYLSDTQSGFRAYNRPAIKSLAEATDIGDGMESSTDILHHAIDKNYKIAEIPIAISYDVDNANSHNPLSHGAILVNNILRTIEQKHPILILGVPGTVLLLIGTGFGYWTVQNYLSWGTFPGGLAISSVFFLLLGIFTVFTAIILHALNSLQ